jgi:glyoxylase-like metal-dependent hydrolase (beta-lactamase superfamily II)
MDDPKMMADDVTPIEVDDGVMLLDLRFQDVPGVIGSYLLAGDGDVVLVETGPASTSEHLERMVARAGFSMDDVSRLIVTHIHLDHAGAAGVLMQRYPHLRLSVQEDAAQFLISVERLWNSSARIYGDMMVPLWGETVDVDAGRVDTFRDGNVLNVAGTSLLVRATPGHTGTHLSFFDQQRGILFTGDAAGARLMGSYVVVPTLSPPELDFEKWRQTIDTMRKLGPNRLALTHMGVFEDVERHLTAFMPAIQERLDTAGRILKSPEDEEALTEALSGEMHAAYLAEGEGAEEKLRAMELAMPAYLASKGILRVFKKSGRFEGV